MDRRADDVARPFIGELDNILAEIGFADRIAERLEVRIEGDFLGNHRLALGDPARAHGFAEIADDLARLTRVGRPMDANPGGDGVPLVEFEVVIEMFEGVILEVARGIAEVVEFGQLLDGAGAPSAKTGAELGQRRL